MLHDCELTDSGIILDGGNVVSCADYIILTDKVFIENGKELYDMEFCRHIQHVMESKVIYLPWHCDNPENQYSFLGVPRRGELQLHRLGLGYTF